jgi:hypothetical protein
MEAPVYHLMSPSLTVESIRYSRVSAPSTTKTTENLNFTYKKRLMDAFRLDDAGRYHNCSSIKGTAQFERFTSNAPLDQCHCKLFRTKLTRSCLVDMRSIPFSICENTK